MKHKHFDLSTCLVKCIQEKRHYLAVDLMDSIQSQLEEDEKISFTCLLIVSNLLILLLLIQGPSWCAVVHCCMILEKDHECYLHLIASVLIFHHYIHGNTSFPLLEIPCLKAGKLSRSYCITSISTVFLLNAFLSYSSRRTTAASSDSPSRAMPSTIRV